MFCQHCGNEIVEGQIFCQHCGTKIVAEDQASGANPVDAGRSKTPWEDRALNGFFNGLFKTVNQVLFSPSAFFKKMPVTGGLTDPLLYAMIIGTVGLLFLSVWQLLLHDPMQGFVTPEMSEAGRGISSNVGSPLGTALMPLVLIIWLFIVSGMLHLFLMIVGGARAGFEATFRLVSYSVSPFLFMIVPYCGVFITPLWAVSLFIIGIRDAHETTGGTATAAVLFPLLFCCGIMVLAAVLFMGAIVSSFGSMMHLYK